MKVLCLLAEGFEEIELITVVDILRRASVNVTISAMNQIEVIGGHGIRVVADCLFSSVLLDEYDAVFLPGGGLGVDNLAKDDRVISLVQAYMKKKKWIFAICAAPIILEKAGILNGKKATIYPSMKSEITDYSDFNVVVDNNIVTGRAAGSAMEFALKIVELLLSLEESRKIATSLVY